MKAKKIMITGIILLAAFSGKSQVVFGIKEGVNLSTQSEIGMLWDNNDIKTGFTLGASFENRFHKLISVQTEINYKTVGLAYTTSESSRKQIITQNYSYYNVPLLLKVRFSEQLGLSIDWSVSFFSGPYFSYLQSAESEVKENGITTSKAMDEESEKSDIGIVFGGEIARIFSKGELFLDLRYEMGLSNTVSADNIKNKVIGIGVGYRF
jgi:hypothetical protein